MRTHRQERAGHDRAHGARRGETPPHDRQEQRRKIGAGGDGKRQTDHERDVLPFEQDAEHDRHDAEGDGGETRDADLLFLGRVALADGVGEDIVRQRAGAGERQPGHDREDGRERDGGDEPEKRRPAEQLRHERGRHVAARIDRPDHLAADERGRAEAHDRNDQVEVADEAGGVEHRRPGRARVGHRVEPHQDVRKPEEPEHQRDPERHGVHRIGHQSARLERRLAVPGRDRAVQLSPARSETARARAG